MSQTRQEKAHLILSMSFFCITKRGTEKRKIQEPQIYLEAYQDHLSQIYLEAHQDHLCGVQYAHLVAGLSLQTLNHPD